MTIITYVLHHSCNDILTHEDASCNSNTKEVEIGGSSLVWDQFGYLTTSWPAWTAWRDVVSKTQNKKKLGANLLHQLLLYQHWKQKTTTAIGLQFQIQKFLDFPCILKIILSLNFPRICSEISHPVLLT